MLGVGGLIAVPFTQHFGRLPVLFWAMFMSLFMTFFATLAPNNIAFIAARCLQGLFHDGALMCPFKFHPRYVHLN
jgi:predicted MFS family arabinose efflux permease